MKHTTTKPPLSNFQLLLLSNFHPAILFNFTPPKSTTLIEKNSPTHNNSIFQSPDDTQTDTQIIGTYTNNNGDIVLTFGNIDKTPGLK